VDKLPDQSLPPLQNGETQPTLFDPIRLPPPYRIFPTNEPHGSCSHPRSSYSGKIRIAYWGEPRSRNLGRAGLMNAGPNPRGASGDLSLHPPTNFSANRWPPPSSTSPPPQRGTLPRIFTVWSTRAFTPSAGPRGPIHDLSSRVDAIESGTEERTPEGPCLSAGAATPPPPPFKAFYFFSRFLPENRCVIYFLQMNHLSPVQGRSHNLPICLSPPSSASSSPV